jgi:peroxiredoxin
LSLQHLLILRDPFQLYYQPMQLQNYPQAATTNLAQTVIEVGKPAPDFSLNDLDGKVVHLSDFTGKPVMINLWASWCIPCQDEMPELEKIYEQYNTSGLVILGVNVTSQDHIQDVKEAVKKYQITYPILLDESGLVSGLYHMYGIPVSYFIDKKVSFAGFRLAKSYQNI